MPRQMGGLLLMVGGLALKSLWLDSVANGGRASGRFTNLARSEGSPKPIAGRSIALAFHSAPRWQRVCEVQNLRLQDISRNNLKSISTSRLRPFLVPEIE